jgi:hypothetical protein
MSRNIIFVLRYYRHNLLNLMYCIIVHQISSSPLSFNCGCNYTFLQIKVMKRVSVSFYLPLYIIVTCISGYRRGLDW